MPAVESFRSSCLEIHYRDLEDEPLDADEDDEDGLRRLRRRRRRLRCDREALLLDAWLLRSPRLRFSASVRLENQLGDDGPLGRWELLRRSPGDGVLLRLLLAERRRRAT